MFFFCDLKFPNIFPLFAPWVYKTHVIFRLAPLADTLCLLVHEMTHIVDLLVVLGLFSSHPSSRIFQKCPGFFWLVLEHGGMLLQEIDYLRRQLHVAFSNLLLFPYLLVFLKKRFATFWL